MAKKSNPLVKSNFFTTQKEGWNPRKSDNEGYNERKTAEEVLDAAGLMFQVAKVPTFYKSPVSGNNIQSRAYSTIRLDNDQELGTGFAGETDDNGQLGERGYKVVQHLDAVRGIFDGVYDVESQAYCVGAIGFNNGSRIAISFCLPDEIIIRPEDKQELYFNIFNDHSGDDGLGGSWHMYRPVCQNTFALARSSGVNGYFTRHTRNVNDRLMINAKEVIGMVRKEASQTTAIMQKMAKTPASDELVKDFLYAMHPSVEGSTNQGPANKRELLYTTIANGPLTDSNKLTFYDLLQGVTQIHTYYRTESRQDDAAQFEYALMGTGAAHMNEAYDWLNKALKKSK